ncbi:replication initiator [Yinghuangia seranimata]|uniref:replication initiator n=1 Tax=Yinghuangia seranimata TaxID=408067 RepID=UPI00248B8ACF|nr:replication initiator [Yinghuangia seranimata]MDI2130823.1 replication initiation protein [Yinghuangia seranimata]
MTGRTTRVERARMPFAKEVVRAAALEHGVCIRPVALRRTDITTGEVEVVDVPCGAALASVCASCAERKRQLRMAHCREGRHLTEEPDLSADEPNQTQRWLVEVRADVTRDHDQAAGEEREQLAGDLAALDDEITRSGVRGNVDPDKAKRRARSTRRRNDVVDLPRRKIDARTVGKAYTAPHGKTFRPSLFVTLTLPSYGRVRKDGTPVDAISYDYRRAARDALHFSKLVDRFIQNLRRLVGFDVQYFAVVEPQRRLAPHVHLAIRGTVSRAELRQVAAATYHQVWWPDCDEPVFDGDAVPVWDDELGGYVDPDTGVALATWDEALDELDAEETAEAVHVARFGVQVNAKGVLVRSRDARRCIGYLAKYLNKSVHECHEPDSDAQRDHVDRLAEELRFEPCSPACANWLRYGVQPKHARDGMQPGHCKAKAHRRTHLGYGGRRVLVSRKWSGKSLADHKHERRAWVLERLGETNRGTDVDRYIWEHARPSDPDVPSISHRLLTAIAERQRWRAALDAATAQADGQPSNSATRGRAA